MNTPEIILASKSLPRKQLLEKLQLNFNVLPADIDESPSDSETPLELVERLSKEKGLAVANKLNNNAIVISSDQIAVVNNKIYGKPGNFENAFKQLKEFSGQQLEFITGLYVLPINNIKDQIDNGFYTYEISKLKIRKLSDTQITNYLNKEQPYNCAASFKIEGLGISLVEYIDTKDFNAIIGLPLIELNNIFTKLNLDVLSL